MASNRDIFGNIIESESGIHPEGKVRLLNGTLLTAHKRDKPMDIITPVEGEQIQTLFYQNAFLFFEHSIDILRDSRMFLAPLYVENNLAYTGRSGFNNVTLGVYIEWWRTCRMATTWEDCQKWLVWCIAGSPLSGMNSCSIVNKEGDTRSISLRPFSGVWSSFIKINRRYDSIKPLYEAYSLQEVVDMLTNGTSK